MRVLTLCILIALAPSLAHAQAPVLVPIPDSLSGPQRDELANRRSALEAQWAALRSRVESHNQKCGKVPANTPLANECSQQMKLLQAEIGKYIEAVKAFNQMIGQLAATPSQSGALGLLSERDELDLGRKMAKESEGRMTFVTDSRVMTYVQGLVDRLARGSTRSSIAYTVKVCNDCALPACFFACSFPGGYIYINSALIRSLSNEAELAAVLAHEVAHVAARHQAQNLDDYARAAGIGVLVGGPIWPVVQSAVFTKFKRDQEKEADRFALEILYQTRIKPTGLITFFEKIRRVRIASSTLDAAHEAYFSSHPSEQERIQNLEPLLADPRFNQIRELDSADFRTVRSRLTSP